MRRVLTFPCPRLRIVFGAVLFDWRGTLFADETEAEAVRHVARSIGRTLDDDDIALVLQRLEAVLLERLEIREALDRCDWSSDAHREATLRWLRAAGVDDDLAVAIWARDGARGASFPFADTLPVLRALQAHGVRIAVVSDIHYDIRDHFRNHALDRFIDVYVLSFEHGCQKPEPEMFERALLALGVSADQALMVGDRASHDGGAATLGIATYILPGPFTYGDTSARGLDAALRLVGAAGSDRHEPGSSDWGTASIGPP